VADTSRSRALEQRLLREVPALRTHRLLTVTIAVTTASTIVTQAGLLATVLAGAVTGELGAAQIVPLLFGLALVVGLRAGLSWGLAVLSQRASAAVKENLRGRLLTQARRLGPVHLARHRHGELATLVTRGLDTLDPYFTGYRPKIVAAVVVPLVVVVRLAVADWVSVLVIVVTLPLVPIFAALVGAHTRARTARQWGLLARLGGHFLDVVAGLPTLRAFGRARHQVHVVRQLADAHRRATMRTLRVAFLSALMLELVATLSVAVVAVPLSLRLLAGSVDLGTALLVLFLAPEAYLPLRAAGSAFHDSAEGVTVAERVFAVLDTETDARPRTPPTIAVPRSAGGPPELRFDRVTTRYPERDAAAVREVSLHVAAGEHLALVGPSGAGKSTLLALLLGFVHPERGRILVDGADLAELDPDAWRARLAWVPQRPHLFAATVADNIRLGRPDASLADVREAVHAAAADEFVAALPEGYATVLGERGAGLSTGQRQRIALARAFLRDAPVLLLDEPTANLDPRSESAVVDASSRLMAGRTAIVVVHRPAMLAHVDRVVPIRDGCVAEPRPRPELVLAGTHPDVEE